MPSSVRATGGGDHWLPIIRTLGPSFAYTTSVAGWLGVIPSDYNRLLVHLLANMKVATNSIILWTEPLKPLSYTSSSMSASNPNDQKWHRVAWLNIQPCSLHEMMTFTCSFCLSM